MSLDYTIYNKQIANAKERGRLDALDLRNRAFSLDGTAVVAEERKAPLFDSTKDYSNWPIGSPVREGEQVFKLLQPHNASHYPDSTPSNTPSLWSVCHTTNPKKAKPYLIPNGTSGMYMMDECCIENGHVFRSKVDNGVYSPSAYAANWEDLGEISKLETPEM